MRRFIALCFTVLLAAGGLAGCNKTQNAQAQTSLTAVSSSAQTLLIPSELAQTETEPSSTKPATQPSTTKAAPKKVFKGNSFAKKNTASKDDLENDPQKNRKEEESPIIDSLPPAPTPKPSPTVPITKPDTSSEQTTSPSPTPAPQPPANGWYTNSSGTRFYYNKGTPVTGWQTMGGIKYYFEKDGALSSKWGIDISYWDGTIDWKKLKDTGIEFVIIRVGYRGYGQAGNMKVDPKFTEYVQGAERVGIDYGFYFYSQAITRAEAKAEANFTLKAIQGTHPTYPVFFDTEYCESDGARTNPPYSHLSKADRTNFAIDFCNTIKAAKYYPGIYASKSWLLDEMEINRLSAYDIWLAHYTNQTNYSKPFSMWQYTESGTISGINKKVDRNICLIDYPAVIRKGGYNHL